MTIPLQSGLAVSGNVDITGQYLVNGVPIGASTVGAVSATVPRAMATVLSGPVSGVDASPTFRTLAESDIPALSASKITSGVFSVARLGTGSGSASNFLRGDGSWTNSLSGSYRVAGAAGVPSTVNDGTSYLAGNQGTYSGTVYFGDGIGAYRFAFSRIASGVETRVLTIRDSGRVGINADPSYPFHVFGTSWFEGAANQTFFDGEVRFANTSTPQTKISSTGQVAIQTASYLEALNVAGKVVVSSQAPNLYLSDPTFGPWRGSVLNAVPAMAFGRVVNINTQFESGSLSGYSLYDNGSQTKLTLSVVSGHVTAPNSSGNALRMSYNAAAGGTISPGFGGFSLLTAHSDGLIDGPKYRKGARYLLKIWANIPTGRSINFASNYVGEENSNAWLTSNAGAGNWREYAMLLVIGATFGSAASTTNYFYVSGGSDVSFTWDVASVTMIGLDEPPSVNNAAQLNIGYSGAYGPAGEFGSCGISANLRVAGNVSIGATSSGGKKFLVSGSAEVSSLKVGTLAGVLVGAAGDVSSASGTQGHVAIWGTGGTTLASLIGVTNGHVLTMVSGLPQWSAPPGGSGGTVTSVVAGSGLSGGTITTSGTIAIASGGVLDSMLRNGTGTSVIGRPVSTAGTVSDIAASSDNQVLRRVAGVLGFGTIDAVSLGSGIIAVARLGSGTPSSSNYLRGDGAWSTIPTYVSSITAGAGLTGGVITGSGTIAIGNDAVTNLMIRTSAATSVIGRLESSPGSVGDISASGDNQVLRRSGGTLGFGSIDASVIASGVFSAARLGSGTANSTTFLRGDLTWASPPGGGTGTVTSVGLTLPSHFSVSGSPVTGSGTLAASWVPQTGNKVLASPNGATGTPDFRALVSGDIPSLPASIITSGTLTVGFGGTGVSGFPGTDSGLLFHSGSSTSALQKLVLSNSTVGSGGAYPGNGFLRVVNPGGINAVPSSVAITGWSVSITTTTRSLNGSSTTANVREALMTLIDDLMDAGLISS